MTARSAPWRRRPRPAWLEALSSLGRGVRVPLDEASLLEEAVARTGLADFGDQAFREPLRVLLASLEDEARLNLVGRIVVRDEILNFLENRLQIAATLERSPEIEAQDVRRPVFVAGVGRSGTTILHELLAQDPANRVPLGWELRHPCPPPETATYHDDPRIERAELELTFSWDLIAPEIEKMHEVGGRLPQECVLMLAHEFRSGYFTAAYRLPSYAAWLGASDMTPAYRYHRRMLQLLQWRCPGERWVLKTPAHLGDLATLFAVYPDARVIQTHRDPLTATASLFSLLGTLLSTRSDDVEPEEVSQYAEGAVTHLLGSAMEFRDRGTVADEQFVDVLYLDFRRDPLGTVARIYDRLGLELRPEARARMRAYLDAKPHGAHGAHEYSFAATGLDAGALRRRFAAYQERYGVPTET